MHRIRDFFTIKKRFESDTVWLNWFIWGLCIVWASYQIWTARQPLPAFYQRSYHFLFGYILIFLTINMKGEEDHRLRWGGAIFALLSLVCIVYGITTWSTKAWVRGLEVPILEMVLGSIFMIVTLEVCRRAVGWIIPIITVLLVIYARFGESFPAFFAHRNYPFERMVNGFYINLEGIMGYLAHVSTTFIFIFVLFGSVLRTSGAGDFFIKLAYALFGHVRGGPGKIAVVASSFFGMVSGSAVANVAGTGQFTIPLMKRYGYPAHFAGGVEAAASAGGQIMPPIMGGAAFIMCEVLGISYIYVIKSVLLIALLFYLSIFVMLDLQAQLIGLKGIPKEELPGIWPTLKEGWVFLLPVFVLLYFLAVVRYSPTLSGLYATVSIVVFSWFKKDTRMGPKKILMAMEDACYTYRTIVGVLSCAGFLVAVVNVTGFGLTLSGLLIDTAHGVLPVLLFLTMISSIILGMGVPITASYVILSVLVAPALTRMGIVPVAAHLFIFYFGVFSAITPPFAPDAFVAGGIAEAPVMKTALAACKIGLIGIILPYMMIYDQSFLMVGSLFEITSVVITAILGIFALGSAITGYLFRPIGFASRICLLISAVVMIVPGIVTDLIGMVLFFTVVAIHNPTFYVDIPRKYVLRYLFPEKMSPISDRGSALTTNPPFE